MICFDTLASIESEKGTCVALGYFDGVHAGHRRVIESAVAAAEKSGCAPAVFTFAPPQDRSVKGRAVLTQSEKERRIAALGAEYYIRPEFEEFCGLSPVEFVRDVLAGKFGAKAVFCGEDFTFGRKKAGNVALLQRLCGECGIGVTIVPMVQEGRDAVSSSRIRACLEAGEIEAANAMLAEPYCIDLPVRHGKKLGTTLGFPTINQIYPEQMLVPREGVYITRVRIGDSWYPSATGLGTRPTVNGEGITCETFIPDFSGELYGDTVTLRFCSYLWPTKRFDTLEQLADMVQRAAKAALAWQPDDE